MAAAFVALLAISAVGGTLAAVRQTQLVYGERIARKQATAEAAKATAISSLFQDALQSTNPDAAKGADYTIRQLLDDISVRLGDQLRDQPEVEATIRTTIGNAYRRLELYDDAEPHLREALRLRRSVFDPDHPEIASSLYADAWIASGRADRVTSERLLREARAIHSKHNLLNDETMEILSLLHFSLMNQGKIGDAEQVAQEVRALAEQLPDQHPEVANILHRSLNYISKEGDLGRAEALGRESLDLHRRLHGNKHPETAWGLVHLEVVLHKLGKLDEAERLCRESLSIFRAHHDDSHAGNRNARDTLTGILRAKGDRAGLNELRLEAVSRADEALAGAELQLHSLQLQKAHALNTASWEIMRTITGEPQDLDLALNLASEAVALVEAQDGSQLSSYLDTLALAQHLTGATLDALNTQERAISLLNGNPTPSQGELYVRLMQFYDALGNEEDATKLATDFAEKVVSANPQDSRKAADVLAYSAHMALAERLAMPAEVLAQQSLNLRRELLSDDHQDAWLLYDAASMLGEALALQGKFKEAEQLLLEAAEWMTSEPRMPPPQETGGEGRALEAVRRVIQLYEFWHESEPDAGHLEKARQCRQF